MFLVAFQSEYYGMVEDMELQWYSLYKATIKDFPQFKTGS
ncbi:hypothetical protein NC99_26070 [Sunxiuqinia dokdonensis]|uniref:Uncharacterized protein n=1 Tax=Sunxiuqinia dokdonensis TaxID=1409788 RepID=A0A0L8V8V5_9BACT|nr:hypothetical protein NC99_26070 [Sunxiuqinia dokdonensis]